MLGVGCLDVTSLCLGQNPATGLPITGLIDEWVPIRLPDDNEQEPPVAWGTVDEELLLQKKVDYVDVDKKKASVFNKENGFGSKPRAMGGRVRVLITYNPHGMTPQRNDVVALEAFARQNLRTATCQSVLPPLLPLHVVKVSETWLLVQYVLPFDETQSHAHGDYLEAGAKRNQNNRKVCMRVHRNAVFVIERKKFLDGVLNLALQPAEFVLSTPLGQGAQEALGPMLVASKQLLMPALLSSKLAWITLRSMALAGLSGMTAAGTAFLNEGTSSLTEDGRRRPNENRMVRYI